MRKYHVGDDRLNLDELIKSKGTERQLFILHGEAKSGKTDKMCRLTGELLKNKISSVFFCTDCSPKFIEEKIIAYSGIDCSCTENDSFSVISGVDDSSAKAVIADIEMFSERVGDLEYFLDTADGLINYIDVIFIDSMDHLVAYCDKGDHKSNYLMVAGALEDSAYRRELTIIASSNNKI